MTRRVPVSRGDTFGRLTALRFLGMRAQQQEWRLRCSASAFVGSFADLRAAIKKGCKPMCPTCAKKAGVAAMNKAKRVKKTERRTLKRPQGEQNAMIERLLGAVGFEVLP